MSTETKRMLGLRRVWLAAFAVLVALAAAGMAVSAQDAWAAGKVTPNTSPTKNPQAATDLAGVFADAPVTVETEGGSTTSSKCWHVVTDSDGNQVAVSGNKGKSSTASTLVLTFDAATQVSFEYYVSSEAKYDKCRVVQSGSSNATHVNDETGDNDWKKVENIQVAEGDTLTFTYTKDSSGDKFDDCFAIRNMTAGDPTVVTFHAGDGQGADYTQNFYGTSPKALKANTFTKDHGSFVGWATEDGGEVVYTDCQEIAPESAMDLYAVWEDAFVVTFDFNDEGATPSQTLNVPCYTAIGETNMPSAERTGYTVGGWFDGDTQVMGDTVITGDVTLVAKWTPITYTVHFNANGGEGQAQDFTATYDQPIQCPSPNPFTRTGYHQTKWNTSTSTYGGYAIDAEIKNLKSSQGEEVTLYAIWTGNGLNLTADPNYEGSTPVQRRAQVGQNYNYIYNDDTDSSTYSKLADPVREGYNFKGWYTQPEGGEAVSTSFKFETDDDFTMYAHWAEAVTVTFDAATNGGSTNTSPRTIDKGAAIGSLPSSWNVTAPSDKPKLDGWYTQPTGGELVTAETTFTEDTTVYAQFRNYRQTITFNANGGTGEMEQFVVDKDMPTKLPANTFTREGYVFDRWVDTLSTWSTPKYYDNKGAYTWTSQWASNDSTATLYATWKDDIFAFAWEAIEAVTNENAAFDAAGEFQLPASGTGSSAEATWSAVYESDNTEFATVDETGKVAIVKVPASGTVTVNIKATVTDDATGDTQERTYPIALQSGTAVQDAAYLAEAVAALPGSFSAVYGTDTSANEVVAALVAAKGYEGIEVSVKEKSSDVNGTAGVAADGTIEYYFAPNYLNNQYADGQRSKVFPTTFVFTYKGQSTERELTTQLDWDIARVQAYLDETLQRQLDAMPTDPVTELSLDYKPVKEGIDRSTLDYNTYTTFDLWGQIEWESANPNAISINDRPSWPPYSPYPTTIMQTTEEVPVELTAKLTITPANPVLGNLSSTKMRTVTVAASEFDQLELLRQELEYKLNYGLEHHGLLDYATGEPIDPENVINDIQMPRPRDYIGTDGYSLDAANQPVVTTTNKPHVIDWPRRTDDPSVPLNNAARLYVYRPMPGQPAEEVIVTVKITDKDTGVYASRDITVVVQPLTEEELDAEIAFMELVKANYYEGIKGENAEGPERITANLQNFAEAVDDGNGGIEWVRNMLNMRNNGIVPVAMDGWEVEEQWRAFRSSNPDVVAHETLLVTKPQYDTPVTITSWLTSEKYRWYGEKLETDPDYAASVPANIAEKLRALYKQPVTAELIVLGDEPMKDPEPVTAYVSVKDHNDVWLDRYQVDSFTDADYVWDAVKSAFEDNEIEYTGNGNYLRSITFNGQTLAEFDRGPNSGWKYNVGDVTPDKGLNAWKLTDGAEVVLYYTDNHEQDVVDDDYNTLEAHKHERAVQHDETSHWFYCRDCDYTFGKEAHVWDEGEVTDPASVGHEGTLTYTCTLDGCGQTYTEPIPALTELTISHGEQPLWVKGEPGRFQVSVEGLAEGETVTSWTWYYSKDGVNWKKTGARHVEDGATSTLAIDKCTEARKPPMAWRCKVTTSAGRSVTSDGQMFEVLEDFVLASSNTPYWIAGEPAEIAVTGKGLAAGEQIVSWKWEYAKDDFNWRSTGAKYTAKGASCALSISECTNARKSPMAWRATATTSLGRTSTSEAISLTVPDPIAVKSAGQVAWVKGKPVDIAAVAAGFMEGEQIASATWYYSNDGVNWKKTGATQSIDGDRLVLSVPSCTDARKPPMAWRVQVTTTNGRSAMSEGISLTV